MEKLTETELNNLPKEAIILIYNAIIDQFNALEARDREKDKKIDQLLKQTQQLQESINVLVQRQYGRKSEKSQMDGQLAFDLETGAIINEAEKLSETADSAKPEEPQEQEIITCTRKKPRGRREADLKNVETVEEPAIELPEEKLKELFPRGYKRLPDQIYPKLEHIPAHFVVHHYHIAVYADKKNEGIIVRADHPHELLPKSLLSESLAAEIITVKYGNAVPLARYSASLESYGIHISRQVMAGWVIELHKRYLTKIYDRMCTAILKAELIHCDETPFKLIHPPKDDAGLNHKSYMWLYHTHEDYGSPPIYIYQYCDGRGCEYPRKFLKDYHGILLTDGCQVYHTLARIEDALTAAGCRVHAKRKFAALCKALGDEKSKGTIAEEAVRRIGAIYHMEHQCQAKSADDRLEYRNTSVRPLVDSYFAWLRQIRPLVDKSSETGRAITYSLNQEPFLRAFLNNPIIPPDNNDAERGIRKFVIGRKNWVIIDSVNGANASAAIYSIMETAKANGLKPYFYFKYIFEVFTAHVDDNDDSYIGALLPWSDKLPAECRMKSTSEPAPEG